MGLNFCTAFLRNEAEKARTLDILRHADHFLSRGGEKVLAMGSDFSVFGCVLLACAAFVAVDGLVTKNRK